MWENFPHLATLKVNHPPPPAPIPYPPVNGPQRTHPGEP